MLVTSVLELKHQFFMRVSPMGQVKKLQPPIFFYGYRTRRAM